MRRRAGWLLAVAIAGLAAAAATQALLGTDSPGRGRGADRRLTGLEVPAPGALTGRLLLVRLEGCGLESLDLSTVSLGAPGLVTTCDAWISPEGTHAVVGRPPVGSGHRRRLWLADLRSAPALVRDLGVGREGASWSPDGQRVGWCGADGRTTVLSVSTGRTKSLPGCAPALTDGGVFTIVEGATGTAILQDGHHVLGSADLRGRPLALARSADGALAVVVTASETRPTGRPPGTEVQPGPFGALAAAGESSPVELQLWRGTALERVVRLPAVDYHDSESRFGDAVEFSPDGGEIAVSASRPGTPLTVVDARSGRVLLPPTSQLGFSWSPDGSWLALAERTGIDVYGSGFDRPVFQLPVRAVAVAWR